MHAAKVMKEILPVTIKTEQPYQPAYGNYFCIPLNLSMMVNESIWRLKWMIWQQRTCPGACIFYGCQRRCADWTKFGFLVLVWMQICDFVFVSAEPKTPQIHISNLRSWRCDKGKSHLAILLPTPSSKNIKTHCYLTKNMIIDKTYHAKKKTTKHDYWQNMSRKGKKKLFPCFGTRILPIQFHPREDFRKIYRPLAQGEHGSWVKQENVYSQPGRLLFFAKRSV